jgi:hypothetical protein
MMFFMTVIVSCAEVDCMNGGNVYFKMVSNNIEGHIVAKVPEAENLKLVDSSLERVNRIEIENEEEEDVATSGDNGIVEIYSSNDEDVKLLEFSVQKPSRYIPAVVTLQNPNEMIKAILYRQSMGGGDNFILAIGRIESDISVVKMQQVLPFGSIQMYFPVSTIVGWQNQ